MKAISFCLIVCLLVSSSLYAVDAELNRLINERNDQVAYLNKLNDSIIPGRTIKLYLLNAQMQKVLLTDDLIISHTEALMASESALSDSLSVEELRAAKLYLENSQMNDRTRNDARMLLILKTAVGILILGLLILIYILAFRKKPLIKDKSDRSELDRLMQENNSLQSQISNLLIKEQKINEEIDRAVETKTTSLQSQLDAANERNKSILNKIDKLIRDLSSVNS